MEEMPLLLKAALLERFMKNYTLLLLFQTFASESAASLTWKHFKTFHGLPGILILTGCSFEGRETVVARAVNNDYK